jgi:hypothetical protein
LAGSQATEQTDDAAHRLRALNLINQRRSLPGSGLWARMAGHPQGGVEAGRPIIRSADYSHRHRLSAGRQA